MKYLSEYKSGDRMYGIYLCKQVQDATTKAGKPYKNVVLQDKTGTMDGKIWEPTDMAIADFETLDYIEVQGEVSSYQGSLQASIRRLRPAMKMEYDPADYLPVSGRNNDQMYSELLQHIDGIKNPWLKKLLESFFIRDREFIKAFRQSSAAKSVHHGFVGGLMEHTLNVVNLCEYFSKTYPTLNRDLLMAAAICHDIGKTKELSAFPANDFTDAGQLLGHIVMGAEMIGEKVKGIPGFPPVLEAELKHCILAHHGKFEFGSPKRPALIEALALNLADNADAQIEIFTEALKGAEDCAWQGYNKLLESNIRRTTGGQNYVEVSH